MSAEQPRDKASPQGISFSSKDGSQLHGRLRLVDNSTFNAIIIHGYAEHGGRYYELADRLAQQGASVLDFDLRGHGKSEGSRGYVKVFDEYLEDFEAALQQLEERSGSKPLLLFGHSNGGLIALRLLADPFRVPKSLQAAIISSPFLALKLKAPAAKVAVAKIASRLLPKLAMPNEIKPEQLTHDPAKIKERIADTLCHDVASARWFTEALKTQAWVAEFAHRIEVPSLWLVAGGDEIADPQQAKRVHQRIKAPSEYHEFAEMHHEVFNELERENALAMVDAFCRSHFQL